MVFFGLDALVNDSAGRLFGLPVLIANGQAEHQKEPNSNKSDFAPKGELPKGDLEFQVKLRYSCMYSWCSGKLRLNRSGLGSAQGTRAVSLVVETGRVLSRVIDHRRYLGRCVAGLGPLVSVCGLAISCREGLITGGPRDVGDTR